MVQALLARVPRLRLAVSATTRPRRPRRGRRRPLLVPHRRGVRPAARRGRLPRVPRVPVGPALRHAPLGARPDRGRGRRAAARARAERLARGEAGDADAVTIFVDAPLDELERRLRERATESSGEIEERIRLARRAEGSSPGSFDYVVENDDRERAADECVAIVERDAGARRYHGRQMIHPRIDQLLDQVDSRYALVIVAAKRARQINNYHHQLGEGTFDEFPPPLVRVALEELPDDVPRGDRRGQDHVRLPALAASSRTAAAAEQPHRAVAGTMRA